MATQAPNLTEDTPRALAPSRARSDRVFRGVTTGAGGLTLVILVLIGLFLLIQSWPAFQQNGIGFLYKWDWNPEGTTHNAGVGAIMYWTIVIAVIALVIAVPISILAALFVTQYAPRRLQRSLITLLDLMAAVPAVIFGIWGFFFVQPRMLPVARWLTTNLGFIPFFKTTSDNYASSSFIAGVIVALMLIPTATSVMREVFSQTPQGEKEAALALGGTRWEMIRKVVLPFGRGGIIGGAMLGLGRALGEAIAVAIIISPIFVANPYILQSGSNSVGAMIANRFGDSSAQYGVPALMAAGLVLFLVTLIVNTLASLIVRRSRSGTGVEI